MQIYLLLGTITVGILLALLMRKGSAMSKGGIHIVMDIPKRRQDVYEMFYNPEKHSSWMQGIAWSQWVKENEYLLVSKHSPLAVEMSIQENEVNQKMRFTYRLEGVYEEDVNIRLEDSGASSVKLTYDSQPNIMDPTSALTVTKLEEALYDDLQRLAL